MADEEPREPSPSSAQSADPAAWAAFGAASREKADAFLDEQRELALEQKKLVRLQAEEIVEEQRLRHWSLRMQHASSVLKLTFEVTAALVALLVIAIIVIAIWTASHDDSAVIEAFKVPPDMVQRGLSGDAIASQMLDRLSYMLAHTETVRAPGTYASNFGNDIKVEIPDTGVSIGEAYRYLARWLGHQTHVSGEVFRNGSAISLAVRESGHPGARFDGDERKFDQLIQNAAEYIYGQTQPFRYAVYLLQVGRAKEADSILGNLALNGPASERPWAYADWMYLALDRGDMAETVARAEAAARLGPKNVLAQINAAEAASFAGHDEQVVRYAMAIRVAKETGAHEVTGSLAEVAVHQADAAIAEEAGDYSSAFSQYDVLLNMPDFEASHWESLFLKSVDAARLHDVAAARRYSGPSGDAQLLRRAFRAPGWNFMNFDFARYQQYAALDDWKRARADMEEEVSAPDMKTANAQAIARTHSWPWLALAESRSGDLASATRLIDETPLDCYLCLRVRAQIEAARNNATGAAQWFARAVRQAPSIPFAYADWGAMLLHGGKYDDAIAKFHEANAKSPHFADPLEMWGEALMQQNRSDLALAKFEEANKYAPNWGRLHLEWGKALFYARHTDEAKKQFVIAQGLDLTSPEKSELTRMRGTHG